MCSVKMLTRECSFQMMIIMGVIAAIIIIIIVGKSGHVTPWSASIYLVRLVARV